MANSLSNTRVQTAEWRPDLRRDWHALRLVRSRVLYTELAFWMVLLGYNTQKRKFDNPAYLAYVIVFFAFWIFMVLLLMADWAAQLLLNLPLAMNSAAAAAGSLGLAAFLVISLWSAARRSPFVFTEQDGQILAATPLDRRLVALTWFVEGWIPRGAAVGAVATVLGYALLQAAFPRALTAADLPVFLLAGLRMFIVALPISLGLLGLAWAVGAYRLRGQFEQANLRWLPLALGGLLVAGLALLRWDGLQWVLIPLAYPVRAGLGLAPWGLGLLGGLIWALLGPLALWSAAKGMSLSRAAQETRDSQSIQAAAFTGRASLADDLITRQRLGASRKPSRLPARPGAAMLVWKNSLQALRRFSLLDLLPWIGIVVISVTLLAFTGWQTRVWSGLSWVLLINQLIQPPLQGNLSRWWLLRTLPIRSDVLAGLIIALPVLGVWLAGLLSLGIATGLGYAVPVEGVWLYLASAPAVALAGLIDVLRQSKTGGLLTGTVPGTTLLAVLLGGVVVALNLGALYFGLLPAMVVVSLGLVYALWKWAGEMMQKPS